MIVMQAKKRFHFFIAQHYNLGKIKRLPRIDTTNFVFELQCNYTQTRKINFDLYCASLSESEEKILTGISTDPCCPD